MPMPNFTLNILVSLKWLMSKEQQQQEQDAENPCLDPPFSRIKTLSRTTRRSEPAGIRTHHQSEL
jgi:hypothetical protein